MISISSETLTDLGRYVAVANTAGFLWRKLVDSPTVQHLSEQTPSILIESLDELLAKEPMGEQEITLAYLLLVALLPQLEGHARADDLSDLWKLRFARSLVSLRRPTSTTEAKSLSSSLIVESQASTATVAGTSEETVQGSDQ